MHGAFSTELCSGGATILRHRRRPPKEDASLIFRGIRRRFPGLKVHCPGGTPVELTLKGRGEARRSRGWGPRNTKCQERVNPTAGWTQYGEEEGPLRLTPLGRSATRTVVVGL